MHAFVNNAHIFYTEEGPAGGLPVLFLHGFPFNHTMWLGQLKAVGAFCRGVAYDIKGHGLSDVGDGQYSIEAHVDDLIAILDTLGIDRAVIAGLSMGGYITLRALERNPERFLAAVLCDTRSEPDTSEARVRRFEGVKTVKREGSALFADTFVKAVFAPESFTRKPDAVAMIHRIIEATPPLSLAGTLLALASRTDTTPSLGKIRIPTLILVGEHDAVTPVDASRSMHELIAGSELHVIPGAGHMSNLENPEAFNEKLTAFLKKVAGR
jgi:pimeloyl-ACP methyl ester carboxylesterase